MSNRPGKKGYMNPNNIVVETYQSGANLRIEAMLTLVPLEAGEVLYRVNGAKGIKMMILPEGMSETAVRDEYIRRYGNVEVEEELE